MANVLDLPQSRADVTFGEIQFYDRWQSDYDLDLPDTTDQDFYAAVRPALTSNGFSIVRFDVSDGVVIATRGVTGFEWASVVGIYRQPQADGGAVKILFEVTQDVTGSYKGRTYSENIANRIRKYLEWHASGEVPYGEEHP